MMTTTKAKADDRRAFRDLEARREALLADLAAAGVSRIGTTWHLDRTLELGRIDRTLARLGVSEPGGTAADWPAWTDAHIWELGPGEQPSDEDRVAAAAMNTDWHTDEPSPAELLTASAWKAMLDAIWDAGHPDGC